MILCLDIGNTNIVIGCFSGNEQIFQSRISTDVSLTGDQYAVELQGILRLHNSNPADFNGAIVSSVVPALTDALVTATQKVVGIVPMTIGKNTDTGLTVKIDNPSELGADFKSTAVAAKEKYPLPCIVIDMGTATTFTVLSAAGEFIGAAIAPGLRVSVESLVSRTSMLVGISLEAPQKVIGANTPDSMKSGSVFGAASMVDGMCRRMADELGQEPSVIATGGIAGIVAPHCTTDIILDENLLMDGMRLIYEMNQKNRKEDK